jgi:hypothetical protein
MKFVNLSFILLFFIGCKSNSDSIFEKLYDDDKKFLKNQNKGNSQLNENEDTKNENE